MRSSVSPTAGRSGSASPIFVTTRRSSNFGWPAKRRRSPARCVDAAGRPVAGATVLPYFAFDRPIPGLLPATTDAEGRFKIDNVGAFKWPDGKPVATSFAVLHPDYPETTARASALPADVVVTLPAALHRDGDRDGRRHRASPPRGP